MDTEAITKRLVAKMGVTAKAEVKWADIEWDERKKILESLKAKHGLNKYNDLSNIKVYLNDSSYSGGVEATINWKALGSTSSDAAKKFANELIEASNKLDKAIAEFKKKYPEVKILS